MIINKNYLVYNPKSIDILRWINLSYVDVTDDMTIDAISRYYEGKNIYHHDIILKDNIYNYIDNTNRCKITSSNKYGRIYSRMIGYTYIPGVTASSDIHDHLYSILVCGKNGKLSNVMFNNLIERLYEIIQIIAGDNVIDIQSVLYLNHYLLTEPDKSRLTNEKYSGIYPTILFF